MSENETPNPAERMEFLLETPATWLNVREDSVRGIFGPWHAIMGAYQLQGFLNYRLMMFVPVSSVVAVRYPPPIEEDEVGDV